MMGYGYEPIIAIICTFRSLISNILRRFKDSTKARSPQKSKAQKGVYLPVLSAISTSLLR